MLKRLELLGFKSFADKTAFDFGPGITAIVGPNGSGKSNVVDAVRWIMGEQSAKSLRGGEMADVIFNGSSSRRGLGMAEVSITLDNTRRALALDADEVCITRRVYRDGQGEYLINRQPARLKDVKDAFLGSGAGTNAYCIIEQGRVQAMLEASTRERRIIFEEAAGISRFKAKKIESLRKLEHVQQNLTRLRDLMGELDRQLRSVKLQAAKAQRFQEYQGRLKELRVALGLDDYHRTSGQLAGVTERLDGLRGTLATQTAQEAEASGRLQALEQALAAAEGAARHEEAALAAAQQRLAEGNATLKTETDRAADLERAIAEARQQWQNLNWQLAALVNAVEAAARDLAATAADWEQQRREVDRHAADLEQAAARLAELTAQIDAAKGDLYDRMRQVSRWDNEAAGLHARLSSRTQERNRLQQKTAQNTQNLTQLDLEGQELTDAEGRVQGQLAAARQRLADLRAQKEAAAAAQEAVTAQLAGLREQRSGLASRVQVLEGLERSAEGLGTGVREVLALAGQPGPWAAVLGLVADLVNVRREYAPLIDLALGERAQYLLVRDPAELAAALARRAQPFSGRVTFLPVPPPDGRPDPAAVAVVREAAPSGNRLLEPFGRARPAAHGLDGAPAHPGLVAPAARLVACDRPELSGLPGHLLGTTLVVRDLAAAREIARLSPASRFITLQGELLEANGTLTVGTHHAESGILSRKSELRELRQEAEALDDRLRLTERRLQEARDELARLASDADQAQQAAAVLAEQAADLRSRLQQHRARHQGLAQEVQLSLLEMQNLDQELADLQQAHAAAAAEARQAQEVVQQVQARQRAAEEEARALEARRHQSEQACANARVALGMAEERRRANAERHQQAQRDHKDRQAEQRQKQEQLAGLQERLRASEQAALTASAGLAQAYLDKENAERESRQHRAEAERLRAERQLVAEQAQTVRQQWQGLREEAHGLELESSNLRHRLDDLVARLREDHDLDLVALYAEYRPPEAPPDAAAAQEEIADLKKKVARLGSVSLDSLQELQELESRAGALQTQHDDLDAARKALDEIIGRINHDSQELFTTTFAAIRGHFQELFRKMFGGGMADVVLEDPTDVLESGVEIVARPPGKELRSLSLLSGGEKTLTAVALLLAIFRSKPSPFCILDEVDAALDEANTGRVAAALRDYLALSQFIVITHHKRTMAVADVLYGVTMQEAGISKRIAVRLEDYPDEEVRKAG